MKFRSIIIYGVVSGFIYILSLSLYNNVDNVILKILAMLGSFIVFRICCGLLSKKIGLKRGLISVYQRFMAFFAGFGLMMLF